MSNEEARKLSDQSKPSTEPKTVETTIVVQESNPIHSPPSSTPTTKEATNGVRLHENGMKYESKSQLIDNLSDGLGSLSLDASADIATTDESNQKDATAKKPTLANLPYAAGQFSPLNRNGSRKYTPEFMKALAKELNLEPASTPRADFMPHYLNQSHSNFRDFSSSQPRRNSSQPMPPKQRKVISTVSLQAEVELKTAEEPWKPELENEKKKIEELDEMDTKRLLKVFRGHLNKLTPQKYDSIIEKIAALDLSSPERLNSVIDLVFDKAVDEPGFCELYARMCKVIAAKDSEFCYFLVKKCQEEFESKDLYQDLNVPEREVEIEKETDPVKKKLMTEELYDDMRLKRKKYLGTIKLIGEMYKLGLLAAKIIGFCMNHLIKGASNENIECLCSLISTVGHKMAVEPVGPNKEGEMIRLTLKNTLKVLDDLANSKKADEVFTLESRIKFKIQDTIDLSRRNWRPRMVENNPKKIEELREEAREELLRQQHQNDSRQFGKNMSRSDDRGGRRMGGGGNQYQGYSKNSKW